MWVARNASPARVPNWGAVVRLVAGRTILAVLVGFHIWLFWVHAITGRLWEPATALRWVAAALIVAGFLWLRRTGWPLMSGRRALVLWLLVAMLHVHAAVGTAEHVPAAALPETIHVVLTQIAAAPAVLLGTSLLLLLARRHVEHPRALALVEVRRFLCGTPLAGNLFRFSPRPPPQFLLA